MYVLLIPPPSYKHFRPIFGAFLPVWASVSLSRLQALRRKPGYPKVLERKARLNERQFCREHAKNKVDQADADAEEADGEPEETSQVSQDDQPLPQERVSTEGSTRKGRADWYAGQERGASEAEEAEDRRRQTDDEEIRREILTEKLLQEERLRRLWRQDWRRTSGDDEQRGEYQRERAELTYQILGNTAYLWRMSGNEEERRQYQRERMALVDRIIEQAGRQEAGDEGQKSETSSEGLEERSETSSERRDEENQWWEQEQERVKQQLQDNMEREQREREAEHQRAGLRKQEEAMMRFKLAAERQKQAEAMEADKIRYACASDTFIPPSVRPISFQISESVQAGRIYEFTDAAARW